MPTSFSAGDELNTQIQYRLIEKLSESERRYRELVENLREIVFKCDKSGNLTLLNKAWEATLGYSVKECLNRSIDDFLHAEDRELWFNLLEQLLCQQVIVCQELRFHHQATDIVWLELSARSEEIGEIAGSLTNITDQKRAQAALRETNESLQLRIEQLRVEKVERRQSEATFLASEEQLKQQAEQLKTTLHRLRQTQAQLIHAEKMSSLGQLVAGIAHEINNPVNFIHGNLTHAEKYIQDLLSVLGLYQHSYPNPTSEIQTEITEVDLEFLLEDLPKLMKSMQVGADRIREIVVSLRNFSRLDEADLKQVDIHEGIDSTLMILQNRLKGTNRQPAIRVFKEYGDLPYVECYAGQLNQVFMNLLSNAIDAVLARCLTYNPTIANDRAGSFAPSIWIRTETLGETVTIRVRDNGSGMDEATRKQIFDPFFTTKPVGKGTGLGLSISYQMVVERHQGTLDCSSELGKGTEFVVQVPITLYSGRKATVYTQV